MKSLENRTNSGFRAIFCLLILTKIKLPNYRNLPQIIAVYRPFFGQILGKKWSGFWAEFLTQILVAKEKAARRTAMFHIIFISANQNLSANIITDRKMLM